MKWEPGSVTPRSGVETGHLCLVAAHAWDVPGALAAGCLCRVRQSVARVWCRAPSERSQQWPAGISPRWPRAGHGAGDRTSPDHDQELPPASPGHGDTVPAATFRPRPTTPKHRRSSHEITWCRLARTG
jgi:hypothetical protein